MQMKYIVIFLCVISLVLAQGYSDWQQGALEGLSIGFMIGQAYERAQNGINLSGFNAQVDIYNAWVREHFGENPDMLMQKINEPINTVYENTESSYIGNTDTMVYHYPSCAWVEKILPENRIWFSSPSEAMSSGYKPCEKCNPPGSVSSTSTSVTSNPSNDNWRSVGAGRMGRPAV